MVCCEIQWYSWEDRTIAWLGLFFTRDIKKQRFHNITLLEIKTIASFTHMAGPESYEKGWLKIQDKFFVLGSSLCIICAKKHIQ
jgi:hypothetical protein